MSEQTEHVVDRSRWPAGPWDGEPDRIQWKTKAGLVGLVVRNHFGALCGYCAVNPGHPAHGQPYDSVDVEIHGGLTYANSCMQGGPICHTPELGEPDEVWWLGFDCNHAWDIAPGMALGLEEMYGSPEGYLAKEASCGSTYKPLGYVQDEVEALARQLLALT